MNIGTAKIKKEEVRGIPHYLINTIYPDKVFTVSDFRKESKQLITDINSRGKLPLNHRYYIFGLLSRKRTN